MSSSGGSWRSGRELISTATSCSAHAAKTASASNVRLRPGAARTLDEPPGAVPEHVHVRVGDRAEHPLGHLATFHAQLRVHAGDDHIEPLEHLGRLVEAAVEQDVDLDSGEQSDVADARLHVGEQLQLLGEPLGAQAVGDAQARRVVGDREVLETERRAPRGP